VPTTTNNVRVVVENVIQDPTVAYSVSGTTLTFTSAPPSGTNNIYVVHLGPAVQTVQPPTQLSGNFTLTGTLAVDNAGTAVEIKDSGSTYGEIGSSSSSLFLGTTDTGVLFYDAGDAILPFNPGTGTRDNAIDLGRTTDRFKDLYLSGGVYLGGTTSANLLDDYETGTWTPTSLINGFTVSLGSFSAARYVKIGKIVHVTFDMVFGSATYASSYSQVGGLPFGAATSAVNGWYSSGTISGNAAGGPIYIGTGSSDVYLFQGINSNTTTTWNVGFTYETS